MTSMFRKISYGTSFALLIATFVGILGYAHAASPHCPGFTTYSTLNCHGYFTNTNFYNNGIYGQYVLYNTANRSDWAIPANINTAPLFEQFITDTLGNSTAYTYNRAGAAFIVDTMLGHQGGGNFSSTTQGIQYAQDNLADWKLRVNYAASQGRINWNNSTTIGAGTINSVHACTGDCTLDQAINGVMDGQDFVFFMMTASDGTQLSHEIVFQNPDGTTYRLRRECANIIGDSKGLPVAPNPSFELKPVINLNVDNPDDNAGVVQQGDTLTFTYDVINSKTDTSINTDCIINGNKYTGNNPPAGDKITSGNGFVPPATTGCPRDFPPGTTNLGGVSDTITIGAGDNNKTICRSFSVNPATFGGGESSVKYCVIVVVKPYVKVFGGDVSAGNGIGAACTQNNNASVIGWNQGNTGNGATSYAGSGSQYAVTALTHIQSFASGQGASGPPSVLAFANTSGVTNNATGLYGGSFASVPCSTDYYSNLPGGATSVSAPNVGALATGTYSSTTAVTNITGGVLGSAAAPKKIVIYVKGDVFISSNITYPSGWNYTNAPLFELVVKGNIYVGSGVTQLDGAYIAQPSSGTTGGKFYTCATSASAPSLANGAFYNACNSKLTVNGLVSAYGVVLLRTSGTVAQSNSSDSSTASGSAAEVFNYNPSMWLVQPSAASTTTTGTSGNYDSITSLPPVL